MVCILITNESVTDYLKTKKRGTLIKLDLKKAYEFGNSWIMLWPIKVLKVNEDLGFMDSCLLLISQF